LDKLSIQEFLKEKTLEGDVTLEIGSGLTVELTHLEKLYWPDEGITKSDLLRYYVSVAGFIMPYLQDRPAILKRYPNGIRPLPADAETRRKDRGTDFRNRDGGFFQQNVDPDTTPGFVKTALLTTIETSHPVNYAVYTNLATLLYLVNLGTIAHNPWHSRLENLDRPDYIVFDLDPHEAPWENVPQLALAVRDTLEKDTGLKCFIKTSGSSGLHLFVPLEPGRYSYEEVAKFAEKFSSQVVERFPKISTLERRLKERAPDKVYLDWLQNARGKAVAAAYTVRAKPGATVSMPLDWAQVEKGAFRLADFTIKTVPALLEEQSDLWKDLFKTPQRLPENY
jgi:bifunctional non-homologous end joining protein LigD